MNEQRCCLSGWYCLVHTWRGRTVCLYATPCALNLSLTHYATTDNYPVEGNTKHETHQLSPIFLKFACHSWQRMTVIHSIFILRVHSRIKLFLYTTRTVNGSTADLSRVKWLQVVSSCTLHLYLYAEWLYSQLGTLLVQRDKDNLS